MSNLTVFNFEANNVRVIDYNGEPWFVAKDVAATLGYGNTRKAVTDHCKHAKSLIGIGVTIRYPQQNQELDAQTKLIPESDVYRLIMRSHLESAERFQDWVTEEVLPSIRKTGSYSGIKDPNLAAIANTLIELDMVKQQQAKLAEQQKQQEERLNQIETAHNHFTIVGYCSLTKRSLTLSAAAHIGKLATRMCDERGFEVGSVPDPRFGTVNTYPKIVLQELFEDF